METPHFPHGWDAGLFYEQRSKILFSSDIGAQPGDGDMITDQDVSPEALQFQRDLGFLSEGLDFQRSLERVSELELSLLATQHGSLLAANAAQSLLGALKRHISEPHRACDTRKPTQCEE